MQHFILFTTIVPQIIHKRRKRHCTGESWWKCSVWSPRYAKSASVASIYAQPVDPHFMLLQKCLVLASSANSSPWATKKHFWRSWEMWQEGEKRNGEGVLSSLTHPCRTKGSLSLCLLSVPLAAMQPKEAQFFLTCWLSQFCYIPIPHKMGTQRMSASRSAPLMESPCSQAEWASEGPF